MVRQAQAKKKSSSVERSNAASLGRLGSPRDQGKQDGDHQRGIECVHLGNDRLRPKGRGEGEDKRCNKRKQPDRDLFSSPREAFRGHGSPNLQHPKRQQVQQTNRCGCPQRREEIHPPRGITERQYMGPEIAKEQIQRIPRGMRKAAQPGRELEFAAIAAEQARSQGAKVERGGEHCAGKREKVVSEMESGTPIGRGGRETSLSSFSPSFLFAIRRRHGPSSTQSIAAARERKSPATRTKASFAPMASAAEPGAAPLTPINA